MSISVAMPAKPRRVPRSEIDARSVLLRQENAERTRASGRNGLSKLPKPNRPVHRMYGAVACEFPVAAELQKPQNFLPGLYTDFHRLSWYTWQRVARNLMVLGSQVVDAHFRRFIGLDPLPLLLTVIHLERSMPAENLMVRVQKISHQSFCRYFVIKCCCQQQRQCSYIRRIASSAAAQHQYVAESPLHIVERTVLWVTFFNSHLVD